MYQYGGFHPSHFRRAAQYLLDLDSTERLDRIKSGRKLTQGRTDLRGRQMLPAGRLVDVRLLDEKRPELIDELIEVLYSRGEQPQNPLDPGCLRRFERVAPQARIDQAALDTAEQLGGRQPGDVLLVEPVKLLGIEDRVAAADPFEREQLDQFVAREHLAIAARGPSEQRQEIHHRLGQITGALI